MHKIIIFTDLDGTLLDKKSYSYEEALPAINAIKKRRIPLVLCTSKTFDETEIYAREIGTHDPIIVENGGGIFIPEGYFPFEVEHKKTRNGYIVIELGPDYNELRKIVNEIKKRGIEIKGFGDMNEKEVSKLCGLSTKEAKRAMKREFDEPFIIERGDEEAVKKIIEGFGLKFERGGRFYHITGKNDKGKAVKVLIGFYRKMFERVFAIALGDSENDKPMIEAVDKGFIVREGPSEWNRIVLNVLKGKVME